MSNNKTTLLIGGAVFCLLASSAWAGGIKHPSDYGSPPGIDLTACGTQDVDGVTAACFEGSGPNPNDFLFTFSADNPGTSILSVMFDFSVAPINFGIVTGTGLDPCSGMNVACLTEPTTVDINSLDNTLFTFSNFTPNLSGKVTAFFSFEESIKTHDLTAATTSGGTTATPEPSEIGVIAAGLGALIAWRRKQRVNA